MDHLIEGKGGSLAQPWGAGYGDDAIAWAKMASENGYVGWALSIQIWVDYQKKKKISNSFLLTMEKDLLKTKSSIILL